MTPPGSAPTPLDLGGRTALVTGAAGGIGRACALRLAAAGAKVRAVDRDAGGLETLVEQARGLAGGVEPHVLDLTDLDGAEQAAAGTDVLGVAAASSAPHAGITAKCTADAISTALRAVCLETPADVVA